jgi:hypothetical protein
MGEAEGRSRNEVTTWKLLGHTHQPRVLGRPCGHWADFTVWMCGGMALSERVYILKAAIDYAVGVKSGVIKKMIVKIGGKEIPLSSSPYAAFGTAVDELSQLNSFARLPTFWQTFLWSWGGFILTDRQDAEYERLAHETGVPASEIPAALSAFDKLFPVDGGWFKQPTGSQRRVLMMMPAAIRGIGAFRRLLMYGVTDYKELGYKDYTTGHLGQDNNAGAKLLNESKEAQ